ncbi:MAG: hypothetical protein ACYS5V_15755, partial [Planctomycetota bacterium]
MSTAKAFRVVLVSAAFIVAATPVWGQGQGGQDGMSPLALEGLDLRVDFDDVFLGQVSTGQPQVTGSGDGVRPIWD